MNTKIDILETKKDYVSLKIIYNEYNTIEQEISFKSSGMGYNFGNGGGMNFSSSNTTGSIEKEVLTDYFNKKIIHHKDEIHKKAILLLTQYLRLELKNIVLIELDNFFERQDWENKHLKNRILTQKLLIIEHKICLKHNIIEEQEKETIELKKKEKIMIKKLENIKKIDIKKTKLALKINIKELQEQVNFQFEKIKTNLKTLKEYLKIKENTINYEKKEMIDLKKERREICL